MISKQMKVIKYSIYQVSFNLRVLTCDVLYTGSPFQDLVLKGYSLYDVQNTVDSGVC